MAQVFIDPGFVGLLDGMFYIFTIVKDQWLSYCVVYVDELVPIICLMVDFSNWLLEVMLLESVVSGSYLYPQPAFRIWLGGPP